MEQGLIYKYDWFVLKIEVIPEARTLAKNLYELHRIFQSLNYAIKSFARNGNLYYFNRVTEKLFETVELLHQTKSDFLSLFELSAEKTKAQEEFTTKIIQQDLTNITTELHSQINNLANKSYEKITAFNLRQIAEIIARVVNGLIAPPIINAFEGCVRSENRRCLMNIVSEDTKNNKYKTPYREGSLFGNTDWDKYETRTIKVYSKNKFFEIFLKEVKNRSGQSPLLRIFKAPKTIQTPILTSEDRKGLVLGMVDELKKKGLEKDIIKQTGIKEPDLSILEGLGSGEEIEEGEVEEEAEGEVEEDEEGEVEEEEENESEEKK